MKKKYKPVAYEKVVIPPKNIPRRPSNCSLNRQNCADVGQDLSVGKITDTEGQTKLLYLRLSPEFNDIK